MLVFALLHSFGDIGENLLAVVARIVAVAVGEFVLHDGAVVGTTGAHLLFGLELLYGEQLVEGQHALHRLFLGEEGAAVGPHQLGDVGETHLPVGEHLQGTHHGEVLESAALHDDVVAELLYFSEL